MSIRGEAAYFVPEKNRPNRNKYIQAIAGVDKTFSIGTGSLMAIVEYIHDFRVTGEKYRFLTPGISSETRCSQISS
jgi:hypothetical protein